MPDEKERAIKVIHILEKRIPGMEKPAVTQIVAEYGHDPYLALIACLLSLRTKDSTSLPISRKLFTYARTPEQMLKIPLYKLENMLYSIGFYRRKSRQVLYISQQLIARFGGKVPNNLSELTSIKGVGRKTANIVLSEIYGIPTIAVDVHVHRIANRLGLIKTNTPEQTEQALIKIVPQKYWSKINPLLVMWGQNICTPLSPHCSTCAISSLCKRIGVTKIR